FVTPWLLINTTKPHHTSTNLHIVLEHLSAVEGHVGGALGGDDLGGEQVALVLGAPHVDLGAVRVHAR
ncbi:unnamed protein product, partial [Plutella xylostella]